MAGATPRHTVPDKLKKAADEMRRRNKDFQSKVPSDEQKGTKERAKHSVG